MPSSLAALRGLPSLASLTIVRSDLAADGFRDLNSVTQLRELTLDHIGSSNDHEEEPEEDGPTLDVS